MANDGTVKIGTELDKKGLEKGLSGLGGFAKKGFSVMGSAAVTAAKTAAAAVATVSAAAGAATVAAIKVGSSFEAEMSKVSAISGATGDDLAELTEKAKEMGAKTKFSASESAQAMEYMAMAGWKTQDMLDGIEGIMNLAAASGENLATTSDIVTDALTAFGLKAGDATHFSDILAAASSNANTNVAMMGETFKYVAPVAGALGFSAEDCAVAIGLMANSGIKASQAGTALRSILTRMAKPTDEVEGAMEKLGISITNSDGSMKSLNEIMIDLRGSFANLSEAEKAQMAAALGGQEAMSGLLAIVGASDSDFEKLTNSINECDGAAADMAATMQDNLQGQITILKSSLEGLGIEIYDSIKEPLKEAVKVGIDTVNQLTEAFKSGGVQGLIDAGKSIVANVITGIYNKIPDLLNTGISIIQSMHTSFMAALPQMLTFGAQLVGQIWQGIQTAIPLMVSTGTQLLQQLGAGLQQAIPEFLAKALPMLQEFTAMLLENAGQLVDAGIQFIYNIVDGLIAALPDLIAYVPTIVKNVADIINQNLPKILLAGANIIKKLLTGIIQNIPKLIAEFPKLVSSIISVIGAVNWLGLGKTIINGIWSGVKALFNSIPNTIKSIAKSAVNLFKNTDWRHLGTDLITKIGNGIKSLITSIPSKLKSIASKAKAAFTDVKWLDVGKNIISGIASGVANFAGNLVNAAVNAAKSAIDTVKGWLGIHSPSRRARDEIGVNMIAGVSEGVEKETPHLEASSEDSARSAVHAMRRASAKEFVSNMQHGAYRAAENNEMAARSKARNNGYDPDNPDDETLIIHNEFNVDGEKLVDKTVRKTKRQIEKEQRAARMAKGDVVFA